jgi:acetoacetyl-CoA synthetase
VDHPEAFWPEVWQFCGVIAEERPGRLPWDEVVVGLDRMAPPDPTLGPRWCPGARINFAENLLRHSDNHPALVFWNERGHQRELSYAELNAAVSRVAAALQREGITVGDRVAGFLPNMPEAVIAMLAATAVGAIWSSCSPDFGANGVLDRFGQIHPRVLFCADGYCYAGKEIDSLARVREVVERIPEIEGVVVGPYLREQPAIDAVATATLWADWLERLNEGTMEAFPRSPVPSFRRLPFDHPV